MLLRILMKKNGPLSSWNAVGILVARRSGALRAEDLQKLGVVMKRAQYFLTCGGRCAAPLRLSQESILQNLMAVELSLIHI